MAYHPFLPRIANPLILSLNASFCVRGLHIEQARSILGMEEEIYSRQKPILALATTIMIFAIIVAGARAGAGHHPFQAT